MCSLVMGRFSDVLESPDDGWHDAEHDGAGHGLRPWCGAAPDDGHDAEHDEHWHDVAAACADASWWSSFGGGSLVVCGSIGGAHHDGAAFPERAFTHAAAEVQRRRQAHQHDLLEPRHVVDARR